jgi:hypothetical protein
MSQRTDAALAKLDQLLPALEGLPNTPQHAPLLEEAQALRRAVAAFHMEAIRFRMFNVDRGIKAAGDPPAARALYDELRHALEEAGFHTRSHAAP